MEPLTLTEIAAAVNGRLTGDSSINITGVRTDSRLAAPGELFVPLKAARDGHAFIGAAFEKGAACALSEIDIAAAKPVIRVQSTAQALLDLAEYYAARFPIPKIAVTGSAGKTTVKDMAAAALSQKYRTLKSEGNFNNEIGVPLTIFNLDSSYECAVFEMGMNHYGELARMSRAVRPDACVITNIGVAHIENFGSREGILKAKSEIFAYMKSGGTAVLNGDDDMLNTLTGLQNPLWYWIENEAPQIREKARGVWASDVRDGGLGGLACTVHYKDASFDLRIRTPGRHMVFNALAAAAVGFSMGLSPEQIRAGIEGCAPSAARMDVAVTPGGITVIDDSYNANPVSMKSALDVLARAQGRRICVLGDMLELGDFSDEMHFYIGQYAAEKALDCAVFIGGKSEYAYDAYAAARPEGNALYFPFKEGLYDCLAKVVKSGDTVLVKASHGMKFAEIVERIKLM